jgi:predicted kinase
MKKRPEACVESGFSVGLDFRLDDTNLRQGERDQARLLQFAPAIIIVYEVLRQA